MEEFTSWTPPEGVTEGNRQALDCSSSASQLPSYCIGTRLKGTRETQSVTDRLHAKNERQHQDLREGVPGGALMRGAGSQCTG